MQSFDFEAPRGLATFQVMSRHVTAGESFLAITNQVESRHVKSTNAGRGKSREVTSNQS
jgi:hypothetical protein